MPLKTGNKPAAVTPATLEKAKADPAIAQEASEVVTESAPTGTEIAEVAATAVAIPDGAANGMAVYDEENPDEDMDLIYGSIPTVILDTDEFVIKDGGSLGNDFIGQFNGSKTKQLYVNNDMDDDDKEAVMYSYDGITATDGSSVADKIAIWEAEGADYSVKKYREVTCMIMECPANPEAEGMVVTLSLPPSADSGFRGYGAMLGMKHQRTNTVLTKVAVGPKRTSKNNKTYYPWTFKFHSVV